MADHLKIKLRTPDTSTTGSPGTQPSQASVIAILAKLPYDIYLMIFELANLGPLEIRKISRSITLYAFMYMKSDPIEQTRICKVLAQHGHIELLTIYMKLNIKTCFITSAEYPNWCFSPVIFATQHANDKLLGKLLANPFYDPTVSDDTALFYATVKGSTNCVKMLMNWKGTNSRVSPSADGNIALCMAMHYGHHEITNILLGDDRCEPMIGLDSVVHYATEHNNRSVMNKLAEKYVSIGSKKRGYLLNVLTTIKNKNPQMPSADQMARGTIAGMIENMIPH
jgi:hypothetical protein